MQNRNPVIAKVLNVLVFLFLYLPIAVLIVFAFNDSKSRTVWSGFSISKLKMENHLSKDVM